MSSKPTIDRNLKLAIKEAVSESLRENREFLLEIVAEVLEDLALGRAIAEGKKSKLATRAEVYRHLPK